MASVNDRSSTMFNIRTHRPGDMGMVISQHASLYAREFGWGLNFEANTARIGADLIDNFDPDLECVFIAESVETGEFLGSIALVKHREEANTARLRLLLVGPTARGTGLGARLIDECILFARARGYAKIVLWTYSVLEAARRLYKRAGFQLAETNREEEIWGAKLVHELWELALSNAEGRSA
ncbi:acyl-CoA N-acyltransferase [Xylariaceae sp. AK1471]|nr:acyl-CoA N-acyltransferase [Xylariaceae sp. AK1471]